MLASAGFHRCVLGRTRPPNTGSMGVNMARPSRPGPAPRTATRGLALTSWVCRRAQVRWPYFEGCQGSPGLRRRPPRQVTTAMLSSNHPPARAHAARRWTQGRAPRVCAAPRDLRCGCVVDGRLTSSRHQPRRGLFARLAPGLHGAMVCEHSDDAEGDTPLSLSLHAFLRFFFDVSFGGRTARVVHAAPSPQVGW